MDYTLLSLIVLAGYVSFILARLAVNFLAKLAANRDIGR